VGENDAIAAESGEGDPMTTTTEDRWPTVAEVAAMIAAWLPEATEIHVGGDGEIPAACIWLPGLAAGVMWHSDAHTEVYPHPIEAASEDPSAWPERWAALYAGRPTRPAAVWRWRVGAAAVTAYPVETT
jgi:hypothetical protein